MRRVQAGEPALFATLATRYFDVLVRVAESRLATREAAEEAAQEALLAAYKSRHTYNPEFGFRTWLWTILLNLCRRQHKRSVRSPRVLSWTDVSHARDETQVAPDSDVSPQREQPDSQLMAREAAQQLDQHLCDLRDEEADALRLRFFAALTFPEIAAATGCSLGTAKNRVKAGLARLAERMQAAGADLTGVDDDAAPHA